MEEVAVILCDSLPSELLLDKAYLILKFLFKKIHLSAFERWTVCHQIRCFILFVFWGSLQFFVFITSVG